MGDMSCWHGGYMREWEEWKERIFFRSPVCKIVSARVCVYVWIFAWSHHLVR